MAGEAPHLLILVARIGPGEAEVTHLDLAEPVQKDIGWFKVSMDNICALEKVRSTKDIVENGFYVIFTKAEAIS